MEPSSCQRVGRAPPSAFEDVAQQVDLDPFPFEPFDGTIDGAWVAIELTDDPAGALPNIGATDIGDDVEAPWSFGR